MLQFALRHDSDATMTRIAAFATGVLIASLVATTTYASPLKFVLVNEHVTDIPIKTQIEQNFVVHGVPSKVQLRRELLRRYNAARSRHGFKYHSFPTNVYVYIYGTKEQAVAGEGLWIGMIAYSASQSVSPSPKINEDRLSALSAPAQTRYGLTEAKRMRIFQESVGAEKRAMYEARAKFSDKEIQKQISLERQLVVQYEAAVRKKFGLSERQMHEIAIEGVTKGWPL